MRADTGTIAKPIDDAQELTPSPADHEGNVTQYQYNGFGDVVRIISPDAGTTEFGYDAAGRLQTLERADGSVVTYTRDGLGRVLTESATWPPGSGQSGSKVHGYVYDTCTGGKGRLCSVTDPTGSTSYTYRTSGELASQTSVIDGATFGLTFTYDALGRLSTATYPNGVVLRYAYTAAHRVKQIEARIGGTWQYVIKNAAWQPFNGPPIGYTYGNGRLRDYSHDLDGRVTEIGTGAGTLTYSYNANDLITAITNSNAAASQTFGYDTMSALTSASSTATGAHSWSYDDNGNRLSHDWGGGSDSYVLTAGTNRLANLVGARPRALTYDANGNLKTETRAGVTVTRKYDGFARLVELARPAAQSLAQPNGSTVNLPAGTWQYGYNALGQRASKFQVGGNLRHRALYSPGSLLLGQTNANSTNLDTIYVWLGREPVGVIRNNQVYAVHADHLGRPEVVTNSAGMAVWMANNYAFDRKVTLDSFGGLDIGLPGQVYDAEAATWYNVFRNYDASTGRYAQSDPIGLLGGLNLFAYVGGNPVNYIDPFGLEALSACAKNALSPYFSKETLDSIDVQTGIPGYVRGNPDAYTSGNTIYFRPGHYDPASSAGLALIGHEATHVEQYANVPFFRTRYLAQYLRNRLGGMSDYEAYRNISFEGDAFAKQAQIVADLTAKFGGSDPCGCQ